MSGTGGDPGNAQAVATAMPSPGDTPAPAARGPKPRAALARAPLGLDLFLCWPLLVAPFAGSASLRLAAGLASLVLLHESAVRLVEKPAAARTVWFLFAALALACGLALAPGFGVTLLLISACVPLAARAPGPAARSVAYALGAALRAEAGALLAGFPTEAWHALLAGLLLLLMISGRAARGPARRLSSDCAGLSALLALAAFAFANGSWLALLVRADALGTEPAPWAVASPVLFVAASWWLGTFPWARPPPGSGRPARRDPAGSPPLAPALFGPVAA